MSRPQVGVGEAPLPKAAQTNSDATTAYNSLAVALSFGLILVCHPNPKPTRTWRLV